MAFKLKVVACTEGESSRRAARRFGEDEKRVGEWRKFKAERRKARRKSDYREEERPFLRLTRRSS